MQGIIIAIDGTAGSGKSTIGKRIAAHYGFNYIDSGALYRCIGLLALQHGADFSDTATIESLGKSADIRLSLQPDNQTVYIDGIDVTDDIRSPEASRASSHIAAIPAVREEISRRLRELGLQADSVVEGRDIGTVVFPDATVKIFFDASIEVRAARRGKEQEEKGISQQLSSVQEALKKRDSRDKSRTVAPLKPADDAEIIDTSNKTIDEVCDIACDIVRKALDRRG